MKLLIANENVKCEAKVHNMSAFTNERSTIKVFFQRTSLSFNMNCC